MEVYATVTGTNAVSTTHSIVLHAVPDFTRTSSVVWLHVPSYPMLAGTTFTTTLFANTTNARGKADSLSTWSIDVPHDDGLTYVSNSVDSDLYDITVNDADGVLSAVATYKTAFSSSPELLTGYIELGTVKFKVASNTGAGFVTPSFSVDVVSMVSLNSFEFVALETGAVFDGRGYTDAGDARVLVAEEYRVGIDGFVANAVEQELINTRVLGNLDVDSVTLKVSKISSCHTKGGTGCQEGSQTVATITSGFSCSMNHSAMEDIAQGTTCLLYTSDAADE